MPVAAILVFGTIILYLLEPVMRCQPLPVYRRRHALVNLAVTDVNLVTLAGCGIGIAALSTWATANEIGLSHLLKAGELVTAGPLFVAILFVYDAVNYWIHRSQHIFDALWPLHRCHHSDPYLDVTSSLRFHRFESIYRALIQGSVVVVLGMNLAQISVYLLFAVMILLFSHTNIKLPNL